MHSIRWVGYTIESDVREKYFFFTSFKKNGGSKQRRWLWHYLKPSKTCFFQSYTHLFIPSCNELPTPTSPCDTVLVRVANDAHHQHCTPFQFPSPSHAHQWSPHVRDPTQYNTTFLQDNNNTTFLLLLVFFVYLWSLTSQVITTATHDIQTSMNVFHVFPIPFVWNVGFSCLFDVKGIDY